MPSATGAVAAAATAEPGPEEIPGTGMAEKPHISIRCYQQDLVDIAKCNNVIVSLATGAGKTMIAAEVIRHKLPELRAANKAVLFMAPTNPLVAQQCNEALSKTHGFCARAYHGSMNNQRLSQWTREKWEAVLAETDVLVMTPDVLLHTLSHGVFRMSDVGLLIFDEAHHCKSDHPYNQLLQDFYHTLEPQDRPQILGLTASPDGMEKDERRRKGKPLNMGLQHNMNACLITVPQAGPLREELNAAVPCPSSHVLNYKSTPAAGVIADSLAWLNWMKDYLLKPAKRCEAICEVLHHQELLASAGMVDAGTSTPSFDGFVEGGRVAALDKQIRGVLYCLENLGPWCAAAAAYLDLLAPPAENEEAQAEAMQLAEGDEDEDESGLDVPPGGDSSRINFYDDLGGPPDVLLAELRQNLGGIVEFLRIHAEQPELSVIITQAELDEATTPRPQDLPAARAAAEAAQVLAEKQKAAKPGEIGGFVAGGVSTGSGGSELEWCARGLMKLTCKVSLLITMNVLADVLVDDKDCKRQLMEQAGGHPGCAAVEHRLSGSLQGFAEILLRRVPFNLLEAQVWPELRAEHVQPWHGPPLLTDKVVTLLRLLEEDRRRCVAAVQAKLHGIDHDAAQMAAEDWWACMVFVETKLSALVLSKLLSSLPSMRKHLRSGYLLGDTGHDGTAGGLAMNNKQQAQVVAGFRTSAINVLIATSVGSEGMDFKQCQLVVAFDLPRDVTSYIQCRGRGRKAGSRYCFMQQEEQKLNIFSLIRKADALEERAKQVSEQNRALLAEHPGLQLRAAPDVIDHCTRLQTPSGALATLRLAQQMLAEYCAKLPGSDRVTILQAYYSTRVSAGLFHTVVYLPSNSGIPSKIDDAPPGLSSKQSKQQAALRALRLLYLAGKLNDNLQPVWVTQKHHKLLEAEPLPNYTAPIRLQRPFHPRLLEPNYCEPATAATPAGQAGASSMASAERTLTLHLHTFVYGKRASAASKLNKAASSATPTATDTTTPAAALAEAYNAAETVLLAAVVGSDEALAALPGGPAVVGGMKQLQQQKLCFGVLLWDQLPEGLMQWPVWIERKLYVMDVLYEGPLTLRESQVQQLLGYQSAINKHINWGKTRAKWLKQARDLDNQEAEADAAAAAAAAASDGEAMQVDGEVPAAAAAGTAAGTVNGNNIDNSNGDTAAAAVEAGGGEQEDATEEGGETADLQQQQQQQQRQPMLPFKPDLLKGLMRWDRAAPRTAADVAAAAAAAQQQQQANAHAESQAATGANPDENDVDGNESEPWSPPNKLSYLIVPTADTTNSNTPTAAAAAAGRACAVSAPSAPPHASGNTAVGLTVTEHGSAAVSPAGELPNAAGGAVEGSSTLRAAAPDSSQHGSNSSSSTVGIDWVQVNQMASGLLSLSSFIAAACSLPMQQYAEAARMQLPPPVPPPALTDAQITAALAAGVPPPLQGAAAMTPLPPAVGPAAVCDLEAALMGRVVVAGHSSHVYSAVGVAAGLMPSSSVSAAVAQLSVQMGFKNGIDIRGQTQTLDKRDLGDLSDPASGEGSLSAPATAGNSIAGPAAAAAVGSGGSASRTAPGSANSSAGGSAGGSAVSVFGSPGPLFSHTNPELAAALLLSSSMVEHDPEKRPLLGWKVGTTEDGKPIWESADRHDEYYRLRCGITGLRPDLPMLAVKSSRGLTDSCLLPPKVLKNSIVLPDLGKAQPAAAAAAAVQANDSSDAAAMETDDASKVPPPAAGVAAIPKAVRFAAEVNSSTAHGGTTDAAAAAAGSASPKRTACCDAQNLSTWQGGPDKRRKVAAATAAAAADSNGTSSYTVEGMDRLAQYEQQQQQGAFLLHPLLPDAIKEQSQQLTNMSRSGRRKMWMKHRVMFLPLELVWLLPITSSAWSQLQLLPNIVYRLDSMLSALSIHRKLQQLLHAGDREAAEQAGEIEVPSTPTRRENEAGIVIADDVGDDLAAGWEQPFKSGWEQPGRSLQQIVPELSDRVQPLTAAGAANGSAAIADGTLGLGDSAAVFDANGMMTTAAASSDTEMADVPAAPATGSMHSASDGRAESSCPAELGDWRNVPLPTPRLLLLALTASSCNEAFDLERLEFLGDVVLKVLASCCMLKLLPSDANEGELSVGKARLVRNVRLAQLGSTQPLLLQYLLRFHPFDNHLWTPTGTASSLGIFSSGPSHTFKGKRLADGVESLIGAFYLAGAAKEAAEATTGSAPGATACAASAAAANGGGDGSNSGGSSGMLLQQLAGGAKGLHDAASWVWNRVSRPGLVAAAAFCEAVGVLPAGAAKTLAGSPMPMQVKDTHPPNQLSLLHPSYTAAINNFFNNARSGTADAASQQLSVCDHIVNKLSKMPLGPFPHTFKDPSLLAQAVTHVSVLGSPSYQRLEFLGDSLLDLVVSLRSLSQGRGEGYHLGPAELSKWRASIVANNTLSTAAVMTGLHNILRANNWRLLLGVRTFAAEVSAKYAKDKPADTQVVLDKGAAATALQLAASSGLIRTAAAAAGPAGAANVLAAAAKAATEALATAVAGTLGVAPAELAAKLAQDVLDDDTIWAAVWMRKKEFAAIQAAAAQAAKLAMPQCKGDLERAVVIAAAAGNADGGETDAAATTPAGSGRQQQQQQQGSASNVDGGGGSISRNRSAAAADDADASGNGSAADAAGANTTTGEKKKKIKLPKVMADLVEALTAAVYCDSGGDWGPTWDAVNYMLYQHQGSMQELQLQLQLPLPQPTDMVVVLDEDDSEDEE